MKLKDPALFRQECYIDGTWVSAKESFEVLDPADGKVIGRVPSLGQEATRQTVAAASAAYPGWKALTAKERSVIMKRWHALIVEHQDDLAMIMTREQGKPLAEAVGEVLSGESYIEWFAEEAKRIYGDTIPTTQKGKRIIVLKEPVGVCAAITPWNFPSAMISRKAAPALAAGCPVIVKPAAQTPLSALALAELGQPGSCPEGGVCLWQHTTTAGPVGLCARPDACDVPAQTGCASGSSCYVVYGYTFCLTTGTKLAGTGCQPLVEECIPGYYCTGTCQRACHDSGDCTLQECTGETGLAGTGYCR